MLGRAQDTGAISGQPQHWHQRFWGKRRFKEVPSHVYLPGCDAPWLGSGPRVGVGGRTCRQRRPLRQALV